MLVVETVAKIRRGYFVQGKAIEAICRELSVSRKAVRKVVRLAATELRHHGEEQPMPRRQRRRRTGCRRRTRASRAASD